MTAAPYCPPIAQQVWKAGCYPIPLRIDKPKAPAYDDWTRRIFKAADWRPGQGVGIRCGKTRDDLYLHCVDFDHKPDEGVNAIAHYNRVLETLPTKLRESLVKAKSTGLLGRYLLYYGTECTPSSVIRDPNGRVIGDFLSEGKQVVAITADRWLEGNLETIPILSADEQQQILAAVNYRPPVKADPNHAVDWAEALAHYDTIKTLLDADNLPSRLRRFSEARQILAAKTPNDTSQARMRVIRGLLTDGYADAEAAALALYFCDWEKSNEKGRAWLEADIDRCVRKVHGEMPGLKPKPQPTQTPLLAVPAGGRPRKQEVEEWKQWYRTEVIGNGRIFMSQREVAEAKAVSRDTVIRREKEMTADGFMERRVFSHRQGSYVVILEHERCSKTQGYTIEANKVEQVENCVSEGFATTSRPLSHVLEEALEAVASVRSHKQRNEIIASYLDLAGYKNADPQLVQQLTVQIRKEIRLRRRNERFLESLKALTWVRLTKRAGAAARRIEQFMKEGNRARVYVWQRMHDLIGIEVQRRIADGTAGSLATDAGAAGDGTGADSRGSGASEASHVGQGRIVFDVPVDGRTVEVAV